MGLAHYKNSKVSMSEYEPVYLALFEVVITPPPTVDKFELVLEQITKISGMATDQTPPASVEQSFKGAKRRFAAALPDATTVDITIGFNVNSSEDKSLIAYKALRKWCDLIWTPQSGAMSLKKDYVGGPLTVFLNNRINEPLRQWIFPRVWPSSSIPVMDLDYSDGAAIYGMELNFCSDFWEDITL